MDYQFSEARAVEWTERIGVDVRPPIEIQKEGARFQRYSQETCREFPELFDRMVLGDHQFEMLKTFKYPGKPHAEARTFVMTPRGPVFAFPRRIAQIDLETDLPAANDTFVACMKRFDKCFPQQKVIRVGKVNEYIFDCENVNSLKLVSGRFSKMRIPDNGEITIRANLKTVGFNRIITIEPVTRFSQKGQFGQPEKTGFGVKVTVDFNNSDVSDPMTEDGWRTVLTAADVFTRDEMYQILNGTEEGDVQ